MSSIVIEETFIRIEKLNLTTHFQPCTRSRGSRSYTSPCPHEVHFTAKDSPANLQDAQLEFSIGISTVI